MADAINVGTQRLSALGHHPVAPANPYQDGRAVTIADPDGWRIVLVHAASFDADDTTDQ